ncbi:hypothetical protein [Seonamhaeicola marinus]|uniref:Uncharacterized protein n=1 Tax=Seonamhaeicola marinus TaxID=1912246 RepID=A0A5D0HW28_9FLAO|nr:hypothetical protein [Seonamhaeicola marinus]TYA74729.1 hypothetical protein FUA24_15565 [Seonamhaeicola marinus]
MKYYSLKFLALLLVFSTGVAQENNSKLQSYTLYDNYMPELSFGAYIGQEYLDAFPESMRSVKDNNKFFETYNFTNANIVYNQQPYFNLELKYDLLNDILVVKYVNTRVHLLALNPAQVSEFEILGETFKRLPFSENIASIYGNGFFNESFKGKHFALYIKHRKKAKELLDENKVRYEFTESRAYVVSYKNKSYLISSKNSLGDDLPTFKKIIKSYYKENPAMRRKDKEQFFTGLVKHLDNLKLNYEL